MKEEKVDKRFLRKPVECESSGIASRTFDKNVFKYYPRSDVRFCVAKRDKG